TEETVRGLVEAQQRTEAEVRRLAEAQVRTEETVRGLVEAQQRTEAEVRRLAEAQARTETEVRQLAEAQQRMAQEIAGVKGRQLELNYQLRAGAYFGPLLRRVRAFLPVEMEDDLEARLSPEEFRDLLQLDLLVTGQPRYREEAPEVWLAIETSAVIDRSDVERARRRAGYLHRAGYRAIPTVTGERLTEGARQEVEAHNVFALLDGMAIFWEEALDKVLSSELRA
ncbi:MAG: hypothetical protein QHJ81_02785, partial [Anaerolineae bacterium]|nr:hypothetical protein [Anaerolineae bacterium]